MPPTKGNTHDRIQSRHTTPRTNDGSARVIGIADAEDIKRSNAQILGEAAEAEGTRIVGNTAAFAAKKAAERQRATEAENAARREQVAQGGGTAITSELRGSIGEAVAEVLRTDLLDASFKRVENSIADERAAIIARGGPAPAAQHLREVVAEAVEVAQSKRGTVPSILGDHLRWLDNRRADDPMGHQLTLALTELREQKASARHERISDRLPELDQLVVEFANDVLEAATAAATTLATAGLTVESTSDEVLAVLDIEAQKAWHAWRTAVGDWSDLQSARRYVAEELRGRGPIQGQGSYALTATPGVSTEVEAWQRQFVGVTLPRWVSDAHSALRYAVDLGSDLTPAGVADLTIEKGERA